MRFRDLFRRKGCEYCTEKIEQREDGTENLACASMKGEDFNDMVESFFYIDLGCKLLNYYGEDRHGMGADDAITIKYCPRCGRKL